MVEKVLITAGHNISLRNFRGSLIEAMCSLKLEVHAAGPCLLDDKETCGWLEARGVVCHDVPIARVGLNPIRDLYAMFVLFSLMRRIKPRLYLGYTIKPVIWGLLAATLAGVPKRVALITGLGYAFTGQAKGKRALIQWIARWLYAFALDKASLVFFQNPDDLREFQNLGLVAQDKPVRVLNGSGVDLSSYCRSDLPNVEIFQFLLIARLLGDKGIREYAAAASLLLEKYPNVEFKLVGGLDPNPDGIGESEVQKWANSNVLEWLGELRDVRPAIAECHVFVLPSYREGTPRTVLESMAMGRPIITTDAPGCRETVVDGENGFLVPVYSVELLAAAMEKFIQNPELIATMGKRSREVAEEKYDVHKVNEVMLREIDIL
ncbi:glycosyltransferase family 4 protein [Zhongshania arctica]|uniref:Glycosyltransferase family 4 protein n=1 Tax=Zhongshania arctica TaxID=3238302 RepID=A0ABV3TRK2_9GAMM